MVCIKCLNEKPVEKFHVSKVVKGKTYRARKCNDCIYPMKKARIAAICAFFDEQKKTMHCRDCDSVDYRTFQYHHKDPETKEFDVSDMIRSGMSIENIQIEIKKCECLCANCHQILHWEERHRV